MKLRSIISSGAAAAGALVFGLPTTQTQAKTIPIQDLTLVADSGMVPVRAQTDAAHHGGFGGHHGGYYGHGGGYYGHGGGYYGHGGGYYGHGGGYYGHGGGYYGHGGGYYGYYGYYGYAGYYGRQPSSQPSDAAAVPSPQGGR